MNTDSLTGDWPLRRVDVVEEHGRVRAGTVRCEIGQHKNLHFITEGLGSYCFTAWQPVVFDALLLAAAVEFCDRALRRPSFGWGRNILLRLPVHEVDRWRAPNVTGTLTAALNFVTGDRWYIQFRRRRHDEPSRRNGNLPFPVGANAVIPFSDDLDSWLASTLTERELGRGLLRVQLGQRRIVRAEGCPRQPFTSVPFQVRAGASRLAETSVRSRGFKFTLIAAIAAYLARVNDVIIPESGQGALGPVLVPVGQAYPDYRNHPLFMRRMEEFLAALLRHQVHYRFPRIWHTKGETLREAASDRGTSSDWMSTQSCWQSNRWVSLDGRRRQCGICAAGLLRRLSVHSAGLTEPSENYVWESLHPSEFQAGASSSFKRTNKAFREYAIAGVLHLDHLAAMSESSLHKAVVRRNAFELGRALGEPVARVETQLTGLLVRHAEEWSGFVRSLGPESFIVRWAEAAA
jgi:7-cyano-7-deazaguanine synthase in queuosine biosynthesis